MPAQADGDKLAFTNLEELEGLAAPPLLTDKVYGYYRSGAESEATVKNNREAFAKFKLLPRVLVDVSTLDPSTVLLGKKLSFPVLIAPMAMQRMAHLDGELAVARAAAKAGIPMVQSTMGTVRLEQVCAAGKGAPLMMFQLYVIKDRNFTRRLIQRADQGGYDALVVTVDAPFLGNREADVKNKFKLPEGMHLENLLELKKQSGGDNAATGSQIAATFVSHIDPSLTWEFISWVRTVTKLPIFVKGVLSPDDAERAIDAGVDGIVVSNHGGRQVDFAPAAFEVLPAVARVVHGRVPVLIDGGVRRGTDIIKALAMGADAVLLGRPILYGLALGGESGVARVLDVLKREFSLSLALMGCPSVRQLNRSMVLAPWQHPSML